MKRYIRIFVLALVALLTLSCSKIKEIHLTSWRIDSYKIVGLQGLDLTLILGVDNPALQFTVSDVQAELYHNGKSLATFFSDDAVLVKRHSVAEYPFTGSVRISPGVSMMSLLSMARNFNTEDCSIDYSAKVTIKGGGHVTLSKKAVPLNELIEE